MGKRKKTYRIPVVYEMWGIYEIRASSLEEAKKKVFDPGVGLPEPSHYVDDSMQIDEEGLEGVQSKE
jgi:hypothetical protein